MEGAKVFRNVGDEFLDEFDSYLQKKPFRHLRMRLPLGYYNSFVLILVKLSSNFLEWLYADKDLFVATLPAENSCQFRFYYSTASERSRGFGFALVGFMSNYSFFYFYKEDNLVKGYYRYTIEVTILRIPRGRPERESRAELLLQEYEDYLSSGEFKLYFKETFRDTVKTVQQSAPGNTATLGLSATASTLGHATAGFAFTLAVDVAITVRALRQARRLRKAGEITEKEYKETVKRRVRQTSCQLVAGSTGSMIGQIVIPVPVVGAMIGGFLGGLIGTGLSKGMDKLEDVRELKSKPNKGTSKTDSILMKFKPKHKNKNSKKIR